MVDDRTRDVIGADARDAPARLRSGNGIPPPEGGRYLHRPADRPADVLLSAAELGETRCRVAAFKPDRQGNRRRPEADHHVCGEDPHRRPSLTAVADALLLDVFAEGLR